MLEDKSTEIVIDNMGVRSLQRKFLLRKTSKVIDVDRRKRWVTMAMAGLC